MEELSQVQNEVTMDDGLFDDFTEEEVESTPTETETEVNDTTEKVDVPETTVEETKEETPQSFLDIQYNKEMKSLTREEAKDLAEKGMNYDKMRDKFNNLNDELTRLAKVEGLSLEDYLHVLSETQVNHLVDKELNSLKEKYPETNEEVLRELASQSVANKMSVQNQRALEEQKGKDDALNAEVKRQIDLFNKEYPNLDADRLQPDVYDYVREGYTLLEAYNKWAREDMAKNKPVEDAKAKVEELNQANKKQSLGNTVNVATTETDDFLAGWNED